MVTGTVTGKQDGQPLTGVSVSLFGSSTAAQTDQQGRYSINMGNGGRKLIFSFIGYEMFESEPGPSNTLDVTMNLDSKQLSEVVVSAGYNTMSRKAFTGSVATVGGKQLENKPIQSFEQALAGQAPGVNVIQPTGVLNNPPVFRIRGTNSVSLSSYPLIIIDGIAAFTGLAAGSSIANNPLADINPEDIESMDILKDASATAIYGSRAANGVVVITTKKGKKGRSKVAYNGWVGVTTPMNLPQLLDARQFVEIKNEARRNAGLADGFFLDTLSNGEIVDTKWFDEVYTNGVGHNHNVSFSGASEATSYYLSVGYSNQNGIIKTNNFDRKIARVNIDHQLLKSVRIGTNFSYSNSLNTSPQTGSLPGQAYGFYGVSRVTYILPPNVGPYNEDGSYNISGATIGRGANIVNLGNYFNPNLLLDLNRYTSENNTLIGNVYGEWELLKGLKLRTSYSINRLNLEYMAFENPLHGPGFGTNGLATNTNSTSKRTDWINTLEYKVDIADKHALNLMAGYEELYNTTERWGAQRSNLTDDYFTTYQGGFTLINPNGNLQGSNGFRSYFSNINYAFDKRYLFSASFRRDGYSGLSAENKFGNFAGGSVGWVLSEESFFAKSNLSDVFSDVKLRASYGQVGNINLGDFPAMFLYSSGVYGAESSLGFSQAGNPDLKWETSKKTDFGINFTMLRGRIAIDADYYSNVIDGMVLNAQQAPSKGIPTNAIAMNVGSMYNKGFEFNISGQIINREKLRWNVNFNVSTVKNRVTALANNNSDIYVGNGIGTQNITRVGYPVGSLWTVPTLGVNPDNGQRVYLNRDGDEVQFNLAGNPQYTYLDGSPAPAIDGVLDGRVSGTAMPTYYGGFNNNLFYGNFDLSVNFTYSGGNFIHNGTRATLLDQRYANNSVEVLERWTKPGQVTNVARLVYNDTYSAGYTVTHSGNVEDASFIRLKNVGVGYNVPVAAIAGSGISQMRIYLQATNLLTFTKYTGSDPEISTSGDSNTAPGNDQISVPGARVFTFGVNVRF